MFAIGLQTLCKARNIGLRMSIYIHFLNALFRISGPVSWIPLHLLDKQTIAQIVCIAQYCTNISLNIFGIKTRVYIIPNLFL